MKLLTTLTLVTICFTAIAQRSPHFISVRSLGSPSSKDAKRKPLTFYPTKFIDTEFKYTDSTGIDVIIQNSVPAGGAYTDPDGKNFGYRLFWNRIINDSNSPIALTIYFPATPLELTNDFPTIGSSSSMLPSSYVHLFVPPDTMTLTKETLYDYGATGLKYFLDNDSNKPTMLQRIINPREECLFYIGALLHQRDGLVRAELVLKDKKLFYRIKGVDPKLDSALIPCGEIVFKN